VPGGIREPLDPFGQSVEIAPSATAPGARGLVPRSSERAFAFCPQCGTPRTGSDPYCRACGRNLVEVDATAPRPRTTSRRSPRTPPAPERSQHHASETNDSPSVGGVQTPADLAAELARATRNWTDLRPIRQFEDSESGRNRAADTAAVMREHEYEVGDLVPDGQGHVNVTYTKAGGTRLADRARDRKGQPSPGIFEQLFEGMTTREVLRACAVTVFVLGAGLELLLILTGGGDIFSPGHEFGKLVFVVMAIAMGVFQFSGNAEIALKSASGNWTAAVLVRSYSSNGMGQRKCEAEAGILSRHGYLIAGQSGVGSHINVGRTVAPAVLTGGISLLFGASRSSANITVTYTKG
jgi:hypothetical protein